ncbi:MAG: RIP metalloprotease RseP [Chitinivibrionales bacterium]|nr:RIP metalloprotease RseP [Chitinivibrionales bacterium]
MQEFLSQILSGTQAIVLGLIILGILVFVHELGHFLMAKWCGIRVLAFSLGFGKAFFKKKVGETEYRISMIPFGGYVHMAGEHPEDDGEGDPAEFNAKPIWQRAAVAFSGPFANVLFSFFLVWLVFIVGVEHPVYLDKPDVGWVSDGSPAAETGIQSGDKIISMDGNTIKSWNNIDDMFARQENDYALTLKRNDSTLTRTLRMPPVKGSDIPEYPSGGLLPAAPAKIGQVSPGSPADKAGFKSGDRVVKINGETIHSWYHLSELISKYDSENGPMEFVVQRNDSLKALTVIPEFDKQEERYLVGIGMGNIETRTIRYSALSAVPKALEKCWEYATMIYTMVRKLVLREVSVRQLAGPVGIVQMSGAIALAGLIPIMNFMALIGINLAILNLLPLIITDGGLLLFLAIEGIRGKPLSLKSQLLINRIALAAFIVLFMLVTLNDISRIPDLFRMFNR